MEISSSVFFWQNEAVEVIEATEDVEVVKVIKATEVSNAREITEYVKRKVLFSKKNPNLQDLEFF